MTSRPAGLYLTDEGIPINTHSMLKTFRRCPKQAQYKYVDRLKPKVMGRPLRRGTWFHELVETYYKGGDWRETHAANTKKFHNLFEEERESMGDLPEECERLMLAYLWHYQDDDWTVHEIEFTLETKFPDGSIYRGKVDMLIENEHGLWIVDHKTHKSLPNLDFRLLDAQSALYVWAARREGIPVEGHIWNYVKTKAPTKPKMLKSGKAMSKAKLDTDYTTYLAALKEYRAEYDLDVTPYKPMLARLKAQQYQPGALQTSSFFRRDVLDKDKRMTTQIAQEAYHTAKRMNTYNFQWAERVADRSCTYMCSYTDLCTMELFGGNVDQIKRTRYTVGDPMDYYQDGESQEEKRGTE